jgi:hypothetical protein
MLRLILFVLLAYLIWRVLESVLKLSGRQNQPKSTIKGGARAPKKASQPPFQDIRDAEFEDLTPRNQDNEKPPTPGS